MRWYTIQQAVDAVPGLTCSLLRTWDVRYHWPPCLRKDNGYRLYSQATVDLLVTFVKAGKPLREIDDGIWSPKAEQIAKGSPPSFLEDFAALDAEWLNALHRMRFGTVARYLASMGRMRPEVREMYRACARVANYEMGGAYGGLLGEYGIDAGRRTEEAAS